MLNNLRLRQKNSFQPLLAMSVVLLMPVFLSNQVGLGKLISEVAPNVNTSNIETIQSIASITFVVLGLCVWLWGSKSILLKLIIFYTSLATLVLVIGLLSLLVNLSSYSSSQAILLMKDALVIWSMTVIIFSLWYWLLDSGWSEKQGAKDTPKQDFLFAQQANDIPEWSGWKPDYIDYIHLAFNTNTAFSPTDVTPLSKRVKLLMIVQSSIALVIISTVAAQAINILSS